MTQSERIVGKFGRGDVLAGRRFLSSTGPYKYTTVRAWERTGWVPQQEHAKLLELAKAHDIDITPFDYIDHLVREKAAD